VGSGNSTKQSMEGQGGGGLKSDKKRIGECDRDTFLYANPFMELTARRVWATPGRGGGGGICPAAWAAPRT
jgi:hypothetical protein